MAYREMYEVEIHHEGLNRYRHIRGSDRYVVEQKAKFQLQQWDEQWQRRLETENAAKLKAEEARERERNRLHVAFEKQQQKEDAQRYLDSKKQEAINRSSAARADLENLRNTLKFTLKINDAIDWNKLKDTSLFRESYPILSLPPEPEYSLAPPEPKPAPLPTQPAPSYKPTQPQKDSPNYQPSLGFLDRLIPPLKSRKIADMESLFERDHAAWLSECNRIDQINSEQLNLWQSSKKRVEDSNSAQMAGWRASVNKIQEENNGKKVWWERTCSAARSNHEKSVTEWELKKNKFLETQRETNAAIDANRERYIAQDPDAIADYCDMVLSNSIYPDFFPKEWDLDYDPEARTLIIEYALPAPSSMPTLRDVQYVQSKDEFKESHLSEKDRDSLYDDLLYQIALRTLHEMFEADTCESIDAVVFNGIVTDIDKTTGHKVTACVLSVLARKESFLQINLESIDPRACFKNLKGVAASKLAGLASVPPVLMINKEDRRFVNSYAVADTVDSGTNLAAMPWEDFEHLIREIFEKEFTLSGGEVKVTQASRDGGVDAVAFDPDPIRGGKIVIQAKRYTNVVGVSAVRDLYGTVINEGATKGVLVTTATYGPDAYEFAKDKPLSLLSGSNLLHLLEKHGHHARIDLHEAKQLAT